MSPSVKGWCPTVFEPMQTGDGLLARIKPPLGQLSADAARTVAAAARRHGSGRLELTNRGALQVRGLSGAERVGFCEAIVGAGLASADPAAERRRNVLLTPFAEPRATLVAVALERWLEATDALSALPAKFSFAVDCARSPAEPVTADIRCVAEDDGWRIELDGSASAVLTEAPAAAVAELATGFLAVSGTSSTPPQRMRELVARVGAEAIFATAGLTATGSPPQERTAPCPMVGWTGAARGYGLGAAFGELNAETLMIAADLADRYATGWLRISASRSLILVGVAAAGAPGLVAAAEQAGFIIAPTDPRLSIAACAGRPACASAFTPTRVDAEHLAILDSNWIREGVHLSGCTKGCAHPIAAAITLVGSADGYDVVAHGRAGDLPLQRGLSLAQAVRFLDERHAASS